MNKKYDTAIIGLGQTGASCLRYLASLGERILVTDSSPNPPAADRVSQMSSSQIDFSLGGAEPELLSQAKRLVFSPGVDRFAAPFNSPLLADVPVLGDIELFCLARKRLSRPGCLIAVTGSNGKSTVVDLLAHLLTAAGKKVAVGGNFGTPALDLINEQEVDFWLLELSSFQLDLLPTPEADIAVMTNIQPDHLNRHPGMAHYQACKHKIFNRAKLCLWNRDDPATRPALSAGQQGIALGQVGQQGDDFRLAANAEGEYLITKEGLTFSFQDCRLSGRHNHLNVLFAVAAAVSALGGGDRHLLPALKSYQGLPHRCQPLPLEGSVRFVDDSKATNVSSACAAIEALSEKGQNNLLLLAGGQEKAANFAPLAEVAQGRVRHIALFGQAAENLAKVFSSLFEVTVSKKMAQAFLKLIPLARSGETLLLSPACASLDEFSSFEARGMAFQALVKDWLVQEGCSL